MPPPSRPNKPPIPLQPPRYRPVEPPTPGGDPTKPGNPDTVRRKVQEAIDAWQSSTGAGGPAQLMAACDGQDIQVAILDTWPVDPEVPTEALRRIEAKRNALDALAQSNPVTRPWVMRRMNQAAYGGILSRGRFSNRIEDSAEFENIRCHPTLPVDSQALKPFQVPDHGLFVADIVTDIAPNVDLSVYRVLDDWGMGDLNTIGQAVRDVIAIARKNGDPMIINLSLGFAVPPLWVERLLRVPLNPDDPDAKYNVIDFLLSPQDSIRAIASEAPTEQRQKNRQRIDETFDQLKHDKLLEQDATGSYRWIGPFAILQRLLGLDEIPPNVLVVAAAGNDSYRPSRVWDPLMPAVIDGVIAVSALAGGDDYAVYSNADELLPLPDGIGVFGGDADPTTGMTVATDGVCGLYVSDWIPLNHDAPPGPPNNDGWVMWCGTSFAAPAITGLAACIWQELRERAGGVAPPAARVLNVLQAVKASAYGKITGFVQE